MADMILPDRIGPLDWEIPQASVDAYAALCGASDPIHVDPDHPNTKRLGGTIAQGLLVMGGLSNLMATGPWGKDSWNAACDLDIRFRRPVRPGTRIRLEGMLSQADDTLNIATFRIRCTLPDGEIAIEGIAKVKFS